MKRLLAPAVCGRSACSTRLLRLSIVSVLTDRRCLVGDPDVFLSVVAQHDLIHRHR
jgi:hypothetical protein